MVARLSIVFSRVAFSLALMLMLTGIAEAQSSIHAEIFEFGTYTSEGGVEIGTTRQGIVRSQTRGIRQLEAARKIMGRLGVQFGFRYKVVGARAGSLVPLTIIAKFPAPGVLARDSQKPIMQDDYADVTTAGKEDFLTWTFEMRSDLVPGLWTFEIWSGNQKLGEQSFEVVLPPTS